MAVSLAPEERAALEAVADRIIPEDGNGPGAATMCAARGALRALDGDLREDVPAVRAALAALGAGFADVGPAEQDAALGALERDAPAAFALLRTLVLEGAFGDPAHGGNADGAGWQLLGYPGPRHVLTAEDQEIVAL
jgi:gluconate 2-dehydrogenase gamma chain